MSMKKNTNLLYTILAIAFLVFCVIAFVIPSAKTASIWISFAFTVIAFVAQIIVWKTADGKGEPLKSKFLGFPLIYIGVVYLLIQLIAFAVFIAVPTLPIWISIVACVLILGSSAICLIAADVGKDEVSRVEQTVNAKVSFIRRIQTEIEMLAENEADAKVKAVLQKLAEMIRYSDPMNDESLYSLNQAVSDKVSDLRTNGVDKVQVIQSIKALIIERNKKCILLK